MEINVCFATNDRYAPHAAALIVSIMDNKSPEDELSFHFFSDQATPQVQDKFRQMSSELGFKLAIYEMSDEQYADFPMFMGSRTTYFRLSMHRFLPASVKKILYLDCDIIVKSSISELYSTDISERYGAVVAEATSVPWLPVAHPYFNAGMLLFNLEKYRSDNMEAQAMQFACGHPDWIRFADQEILNYIFKGNVVFLPLTWNMMLEKTQRNNCLAMGYKLYPYSEKEMHEAEREPNIIHYVTRIKPWHYECRHPKKAVYWKYVKRTPFYEQVRKQYNASFYTHLWTPLKTAIGFPERFVRRIVFKPLKNIIGLLTGKPHKKLQNEIWYLHSQIHKLQEQLAAQNEVIVQLQNQQIAVKPTEIVEQRRIAYAT